MSSAPQHRIFTTSFAAVYPLYLAKLERKGRSRDELDAVICWLTGLNEAELAHHLATGSTFAAFFADACLPEAAVTIRGVVCGVRVGRPLDAKDSLPRQACRRTRQRPSIEQGVAQLRLPLRQTKQRFQANAFFKRSLTLGNHPRIELVTIHQARFAPDRRYSIY